MVADGSAAPEAMIRAFDQPGIHILHAWGMTEMSPLGTVSRLKSYLSSSAGSRSAPWAWRTPSWGTPR